MTTCAVFRVMRRGWKAALMMTLTMSGQAWAQSAGPSAPSLRSESHDHSPANGTSGMATKNNAGRSTDADELRPDSLQPGEDPQNRLGEPFLKHLITDQKWFWTAPARAQAKDLNWILPAAGV